MMNELRIARDLVALEAFSAPSMMAVLRNALPGVIVNFNQFVGKFSPNDQAIVLSAKHNDFYKEVQKHSFLDIAMIAAYVSEGLNVQYLEYAHTLQGAVTHCSTLMERIMNPYSVFLSQLITNKEQQLSTLTLEPMYRHLAKERDAINKALGACFKNGSTRTQTSIDEVVSRNGDWPVVLKLSEELSKDINRVDRKALNKKAQECAQLLSVIADKIKRGDLDGASPEVADNLANGAYQVASELEFFSVTYYKVTTYVEALNHTMAHFTEVFKK